MQRAAVGLGIDRHGGDAHAAGGLDDAAGDFAAICDQYFAEQETSPGAGVGATTKGLRQHRKPLYAEDNGEPSQVSRTLSPAPWPWLCSACHIENGLSVALGVGLTGLLVGGAAGFAAAVAAATGAVAVSVSDQPDPLRQKPWVLGFAFWR